MEVHYYTLLYTVLRAFLIHLPAFLTQVKKGPGSSINFNTGARAVSGSTHIAVLKMLANVLKMIFGRYNYLKGF